MNVPKLRFPEFEGEWGHTTLGDVGKVIRGASPRPKGDPRYYGGNVPRLMGEDVTRDGKYVTPRIDTLTEEGAKLSRPCPAGTLTIICSGNVGIPSILAVDACIHDGFLALINISPQVDTEFLYSQLSRLREQFDSAATHGGVFVNLTTDILREFPAAFPSLPEQKKIAAFLGVVDAKIAALRARRDGLERYKRGLMQALFSQTLRFTKPDGTAFPDWEEKRLGELLTVRYGKDHKDIPDGEIPVFGTGGIMRYVDRSLHDGPSVLIGRKGTIDKPRYVTHPFWTVDTLFYSDIKRGYLPSFVFLVVQSINWLKHNEATGVPSLSATAIQSVKVSVPPHPDEQQKIADALSTIDAKIAAVADQVRHMETFKKGLLQQMFV